MDKKQFESMLILIVPAVVKLIASNNNLDEIKDTRKGSSGRPLERELSDKEKLERAESKIKLLEAENELLKKTSW